MEFSSQPEEIPMKKLLTKIAWMVTGLVLACFCSVPTHAQATIAPDNYPRSNTAPITDPAVKVEFQGNFSLPNEVQCHGHKLAPGKYTLMVKTVGTDKMVTLQREGSDIVLQSRPVTPTSVSDQGHSAVLVRHGPGPGTHTLEGVYVEILKLVLFLDESGHTKSLDKMFASVMRVPIS
jgi:hypothetical protein